jgi:OmpA-OmpF porin, OOP family
MMRRGRVGWWAAVAALGIGLATGGQAHAQREVNIPRVVFSEAQIFHPATDPSRFVSVYDTRNLEPGQYTLGLYGTFAENPIDLSFDSSGDRSSHLVRYSIGADLIAAVGITERFQLGLDIPGVYNSTEPVVNLASNTEPGGGYLGDVTLEGKITLIPRPPGKGFGFSLLPRVVAPTGNREKFAGTGKVGGGGLMLFDWRYAKINYGLNLGGIFRNSDEVDDQFQGGFGVTVPAAKFLDVIGEVTARTAFRGERTSPVEGLVSARFHKGGIAFTIGAGAGLTTGRGAAEYRFVAGITPYIPEKEIPPPRADLVTNSRKTWKLAADLDNDGRTNPGDTVEYTVDVANTGTAPALEVVFVDAIPEHTSYVPGSMILNGGPLTDGADADAGDFNLTTPGAVTVNVGTIGNEQGQNAVTFSFRVTINPDIVDITNVRNEAIVSQKNWVNPDEVEGEVAPRVEENLPVAETTVFPRLRERETVVVTPDKLELTRNIHFEFNKATIRPESYPILNDVAAVLKDNPQLNIMIEGHTDAVGGVEYNQKLSDRRAQSVKAFLVSKGVASSRLATKGQGKLQPIASNDTAVGRALNRRVEFLIVNPEVVKGKSVEKRSFVEDITPQSEPANIEERLPGARKGGDRDTIETQQALRRIGYLSEEPSGIMTAETKAALEKFQKDNGLPVTGAADAITRKALDEAVELQRSR